MNFIELFNAVLRVAKPAQSEYVDARSMDDSFRSLEIDSLDGLVMLLYLSELYGIDDTVSREWRPASLGQLHELLMAGRTREPQSVEDAVRAIT